MEQLKILNYIREKHYTSPQYLGSSSDRPYMERTYF
jgi:hypothetical protein